MTSRAAISLIVLKEHKNTVREAVVSLLDRKMRCLYCRVSSKPYVVGMCGILIAQAVSLVVEACRDSPTFNEPMSLAAGVSIWETGQFNVYSVNPPLVRALAAIPTVILGYEPFSGPSRAAASDRVEALYGERFCRNNGESLELLVAAGRIVCMPFALVGTIICFLWSRELYGPKAGILAASLFAFCPNLRAHGHLITTDVPATSMMVAAAFLHWRWRRVFTLDRAILAGGCLGFALLTKYTALLLPLWFCASGAVLVASLALHRKMVASISAATGLLVQMVLALIIVNLGFLYQGSWTPVADLGLRTTWFDGATGGSPGTLCRGALEFAKSCCLPIPADYLIGADIQQRDFEDMQQQTYVAGRFSNGVPWFYAYAMAVKLTEPTLACLALRVIAGFIGHFKFAELSLLGPMALIFGVASEKMEVSQQLRYVLPTFPFVYIWVSAIASVNSPAFVRRCAVPLVFAIAAVGLSASPHSLSYFNIVSGGMTTGANHLLFSNICWGQDIKAIREWQQNNPDAKPLIIAHASIYDPAIFGIEYELPAVTSSGEHQPGWYAVSVNIVKGSRQQFLAGNTPMTFEAGYFKFLDRKEMMSRIGYSINVYRIDSGE